MSNLVNLIKTAGSLAGFNRELSEDDFRSLTSAYLSDIGISQDTLDEEELASARAHAIRTALVNQIYQQETGRSRDPVSSLMAAIKKRKLTVPAQNSV